MDTNTFYPGDRDTTEKHRDTIRHNGWTFCPVDIMDEDGTAMLPVKGAKWIPEISVGSHLLNYDSLFVLTHFKGHVMGGFGGSNKNIGIGCADALVGKAQIHTKTGKFNHWDIAQEELMERMAESTKATIDHFGKNITFVNVLRNMSVSCDCEGRRPRRSSPPTSGSWHLRISWLRTRLPSTWSLRFRTRTTRIWWSA